MEEGEHYEFRPYQMTEVNWSAAEAALCAPLDAEARQKIQEAVDLYLVSSSIQNRLKRHASRAVRGKTAPDGKIKEGTTLLKFRKALAEAITAWANALEDPDAKSLVERYDLEAPHARDRHPNLEGTLSAMQLHSIGLGLYISDIAEKRSNISRSAFDTFVAALSEAYIRVKGKRPPKSNTGSDFTEFVLQVQSCLPEFSDQRKISGDERQSFAQRIYRSQVNSEAADEAG